jgi:hypothetical protein
VKTCQSIVQERLARARFNALLLQHSTPRSGVELPVARGTEFGIDYPTGVEEPEVPSKIAKIISRTKVIDDCQDTGPLVTG